MSNFLFNFELLSRLVPLYALVIVFNATWLMRLGDGPVWRRITEPEKYFCRVNSWTNFLFINNYISVSEPVSGRGK